jgi:ketosteroid isomerase-like protein
MTEIANALRTLKNGRLQALVAADADVLESLHAAAFVLVTPSGGVWSKAEHIGGVLSGRIDYRRFEAVSDIEVMADGDLAVLRYRSAIDIHVQGQQPGPLACWHTDCYRRTGQESPWQVVWSQATEIQ